VRHRLFAFLTVGVCIVGPLRAQPQISPEFQGFVTDYVAAYNAKDAARLLALYGSASRACITSEDRDFYDAALAVMWRDPIPPRYRITVEPVNENNLKAIETFGRFPVKPTRELHIDYQQGEDAGTVIVYMVQENGRWRADQPCATAQTVKQFHADAPARKEREAHYQSIADAIDEPLRTQLIDLLREHKTAAAIDRYKAASGQDTQTAMFVMNQLALRVKR
jgi:hypothetical protein